MKWTMTAGLLLSMLALPGYSQSAYTLKEGDVLNISVWGESELDLEIKVLPDGSVSFPLVGTVPASGSSAADLEQAIAEGISKYIPDATVSVVVADTLGNRIYVLGNVSNPGSYIMSSPLSVVQALSLAGGLSTFADENDILILRNASEGQTRLSVRYNDIMSGKKLQTNHQLQAGDIILVP